ncbi:Exosome complex component RRP46 [Blattella germanica]|nr:Exosome complex component RRP46 [Blattella germanica]
MDTENDEEYLRPFHCELNVLSRADGSAILTQGDTTVMTAVYGPVEVKLQRIRIDKASVEAIYRPKSGVTDRMRESLLRNTCEISLVASLYPRTSVSVIIQEIQDSGGLMACAVNAACLALMNSGIAMKFLVAAVGCMIDQDDKILIDPNNKQLKRSIVASHTSGSFTQTQYQECLLRCKDVSGKIFTFYRDLVKKCVENV